jgi:electron transfer flavoprotein alpha/beta subunit
MQAVSVMRRTFDPGELSSLTIVDKRIVADRMKLVKNEGDVRAIQLVKSSGVPFQVLTIGDLDDITRVHLFVYGAQEVWALGESRSSLLPETQVARMLAAHIRRLDDVQVVGLGGVEQDTGRNTLAGLLAAQLGWELFSNVLSLRVQAQRAQLRQVIDGGIQEIEAALPICVSADEACEMGTDPSDEYDLIEKLEKRGARTTTLAELGIAIADVSPPEFCAPPQRQAQPVVASGADAVARVAGMIRRFQG